MADIVKEPPSAGARLPVPMASCPVFSDIVLSTLLSAMVGECHHGKRQALSIRCGIPSTKSDGSTLPSAKHTTHTEEEEKEAEGTGKGSLHITPDSSFHARISPGFLADNCFSKDQTANILGFSGYTASVTTTQLCCMADAATDNT